MAYQWPVDCDTPRKRLQFCLRFKEVLRRIYNGFGKWRREGLTTAQYDKLVAATAHFIQKIENPSANIETIKDTVRAQFPYTQQLLEADWLRFRNKVWKARSAIAEAMVVEQRTIVAQLLDWSEQVDEL